MKDAPTARFANHLSVFLYTILEKFEHWKNHLMKTEARNRSKEVDSKVPFNKKIFLDSSLYCLLETPVPGTIYSSYELPTAFSISHQIEKYIKNKDNKFMYSGIWYEKRETEKSKKRTSLKSNEEAQKKKQKVDKAPSSEKADSPPVNKESTIVSTPKTSLTAKLLEILCSHESSLDENSSTKSIDSSTKLEMTPPHLKQQYFLDFGTLFNAIREEKIENIRKKDSNAKFKLDELERNQGILDYLGVSKDEYIREVSNDLESLEKIIERLISMGKNERDATLLLNGDKNLWLL